MVSDLLRMEHDLVSFRKPFSTIESLMFVYSVFEYTYLLFWNVFWSLAPVIAIGIFDRVIG